MIDAHLLEHLLETELINCLLNKAMISDKLQISFFFRERLPDTITCSSSFKITSYVERHLKQQQQKKPKQPRICNVIYLEAVVPGLILNSQYFLLFFSLVECYPKSMHLSFWTLLALVPRSVMIVNWQM